MFWYKLAQQVKYVNSGNEGLTIHGDIKNYINTVDSIYAFGYSVFDKNGNRIIVKPGYDYNQANISGFEINTLRKLNSIPEYSLLEPEKINSKSPLPDSSINFYRFDSGYKEKTIRDEAYYHNIERYNFDDLLIFSANLDGNLSNYISKVFYIYDMNKRLIKVIHPDESVTEYRYDFLGNLISKETPFHNAPRLNTQLPESDIEHNPDFRYIYDSYGRQRFYIDPLLLEKGKTSYTKYDLMGRIVEVGLIDNIGLDSLQEYADDNEFPANGDWLVKYII